MIVCIKVETKFWHDVSVENIFWQCGSRCNWCAYVEKIFFGDVSTHYADLKNISWQCGSRCKWAMPLRVVSVENNFWQGDSRCNWCAYVEIFLVMHLGSALTLHTFLAIC